jgi:hypothetical protein
MKKLLSHLFHGLVLMAIALGVFLWSFFYEGSIRQTTAVQQGNQVILKIETKAKVDVNRDGAKVSLTDGKELLQGDIVESGDAKEIIINFAGDGELRLDSQTKVLLSYLDNDNSAYSFKLMQGRVWLNNSYTNADLNLVLDGGVVFPSQSVVYAKQEDGQAGVYVNKEDAVLGVVSPDFAGNEILTENDAKIINKLYLPQGTMANVFADKIRENQATIARLLFSKMVKEFNYSLFDKETLISDAWLSDNLQKDLTLTTKIRDLRLKSIRTRGIKYSSLDASNYKIDQVVKDVSNALTFSDARVGKRNLDALYDLLYDSQYLFDYNRKQEAQERLNSFTTMANQLFLVYGDDLKKQYIERVKSEYEYLSFASPTDSLFELKQVLQKIYLDSIKGQPEELFMKFAFLTDDLSIIGFYAENAETKNIDNVFDGYMTSFKDLTEKYQKDVTENITYVQRQNQGLDNLFMQYPALYREKYFTKKLFVENKYLSLLPQGNDRLEEIQSVIAQRIDFLRRLENYFLDGNVPLIDAQNILALLFHEIGKIELPSDYQVAVKTLFTDRLQDYGLFSSFLNSPEYVSSNFRGTTPRQRFEAFKKDNPQVMTVEELTEDMTQQVNAGGNQYELGTVVPAGTTEPVINEETVTTNIDGQTTVTENQVNTGTGGDTTTTPVKVPRVKRPT